MARLWTILLLLALIAAPVVIKAAADETEDEARVEDEKDNEESLTKTSTDDEEDVTGELKPSPDADVHLLFTKPSKTKELPAGSVIKFLVSFLNKGDKQMIVHEMDASFRYPGDYNFFIQNYTAATFNRVVDGGHESTFDYAFAASEQYAGRPLGLIVQIRYRDVASGVLYQHSVFNETVNIVEDESTFNPETGFLYMVFAILVVLLMLLGQQMLSKMRKRHGMSSSKSSSKSAHSQSSQDSANGGGQAKDTTGIDFEWIPRQVQNIAKNSPGRSPPASRGRAKKDE